MRIYFYPECNFNINKAKTYDVTSLAEWFDSQHKNPDDYEIVGRDGKSHDSAYEAEVCAVYPKIMGGKSKGKNILKVVVGLALVLATGGTTAALFSNIGGLSMAHTLGAGLLLSGGGALLMGKMKMPSMDLSSDSATKQNYQWNVGNLSTSRGVKGVTFGSDVIPEGELLAYRTYGTSTLEKLTRSETYYVNETYKTGRQVWDYASYSYVAQTATRKVAKTRTVDDSYLVKDDSSYLELLIGAGEGELDSITDIRINDISLSDLEMVEDVDYAIRLGSNTQTALKQTNLDSQAGYQSIGQTVPVKLNGSVTPLLITTPSDCDSCCIAFQAQNWYLYDTSSGAKNKAYIKPKIGYRLNGSTGAYTYIKTGVSEIDSGLPIKSDSAFYFQVVIKFPSNGTYQISIENDSAELNNTKGLLSNAEYSGSALPDRAAINISVDNIACYNNKEQTYPNTALIWLRIPASQTLNGSMPKVTWKQTRASIYAYNGSSYVTKPADNLAWAIYDIIAQVRKDGNTYHNEGEDVNNIDFDKFVSFATFCESIGATGNWFLNKLDTSWSNAMSVATSCRAFIGLRSGKVCPYWDAPTEMTQIFTVGNYEDMSGVITAKKDRAKAIEATFNNEEEKYASRTVRVEIDNDHSSEAVSMTFVGLNNPVNVSKQAHYILRRNKYLVQSIKFTADIDSIVCELNDVIGIQCDLTEYGVGGRIFKVENGTISLDAPVTLVSGNAYALLVRHTDGTLERNTPVETNGTYTQLTFNSAWSKPVLKGDVYSFGIANSEVRKYRVTGITRTNDLKAQIEAIEYNENVYDELAVAPYTYTNPNAGINNVTTTYTPEAVELAWDANNNTSYVNVYVDGVFYGRYQNGAQIPNINSEQLVEMFPVNEYGEEDTPVVRTISNNLPTPSTPPVPIVQSTTTGCVAEFDGIPKDENIVWLIIKEGDNELGRANILGEYMSVSIQLRSGTHTLSAYFVNQFSKSSQARTFTATPLGDIQANDISATALKLPTGSILRLSAKNCTTASIAEDKGVKDCSGWGHHGRAYGGVIVLNGGEGFSFDGTDDYILFPNNILSESLTSLTICLRLRSHSHEKTPFIICKRDGGTNFQWQLSRPNTDNANLQWTLWQSGSTRQDIHLTDLDFEKWYHTALVFDNTTLTYSVYLDGVLVESGDLSSTINMTNAPLAIGRIANISYSNYFYKGDVTDVRIYPRGLSATEVKSVFMMPDEAVFAQLTADLIGANIIKASNLVLTENIITTNAQIKQAVIDNMTITGNANFIAEQQARAQVQTNLNTVTTNIYSPNTTTINGGKITTGTITAAAIAANAITAEKLNVTSGLSFPSDYVLSLVSKGLPIGSITGQVIPEESGRNYHVVAGSSNLSIVSDNKFGTVFNFSAVNNSGITVKNFYGYQYFHVCFWFKSATTAPTNNMTIYDHRSGTSSNGVVIALLSTKKMLFQCGVSTLNLQVTPNLDGDWHFYNFILAASGAYIYEDCVLLGSQSGATATYNYNRDLIIGQYINGGNNGVYGYIAGLKVFSHSPSIAEIRTLYMARTSNDSGQITADRIAAGSIETRHLTADAIVGKTFQTASNTGTSNAAGVRFNSSGIQGFNGSAKTFDLSTNGKLTCSDVDLTGKITASSGKIGDFSLNQDVSVAVTASETKTYTCGFSGTVKKSSSDTKDKAGIFLKVDSTSSYNACGILIDNQGQYANSGISVKTHGSQEESYGISTLKYGSGTSNALLVQNQGSSTSNYAAGAFFNASSNNVYSIYVSSGKAASAGGWSTTCDESVKKDIKDVSTLEKLKGIRVKKFRYSQKAIEEKEWRKKQSLKIEENLEKGIKTEEEKMPEFKDDENAPDYIMAMAGEFNKAFGVDNGNEEEINYTNAIGVALRAIQELADIVDSQKSEIAELKALLKNQQDSKSELTDHFNDLVKEPTNGDGLIEPSFDELLKDEENQQEEQK